MILAQLNREDIGFITRRLRQRDRDEIFATRWHEDAEILADETMQWGSFGWVAGLDEPIAAIGASSIWPGRWAMWAYGTDRWPEIALSLTRHARNVMLPALWESGMVRAECKSMDRHVQAHRWMELLGAIKESESPHFGKNGETFFTYVWLRDRLLPTDQTKQTTQTERE